MVLLDIFKSFGDIPGDVTRLLTFERGEVTSKTMPRHARIAPGGLVYHVLNRSVARLPLFQKPADYQAFAAVSYAQLNRVRAKLYQEAKRKGYQFVSYVSSRAFVWRNVEIGENCFIMENNVLQYAVRVGNNVVLWSGNHVGHQSVIRDNVFVSSHVVISGYCEIGENCFLGVNSCIANNVTIAKDCLIGMGAVVHKNTQERKVYVGNPAKALPRDSHATFGVRNQESA